MNPGSKKAAIVGASLVAIALSAFVMYRQLKAPAFNVALHQRVGQVMAEQTAKALGQKGRVVLITIPTGGEPELATQLDAFRATLKKLGDFEIKEKELDTKDQPKYGVGNGLSGRRFLRTIKNNPNADAIVSFVGVPSVSDEELADLKKVPKFIAETRSPDHLPKLFEKRLIEVAVVSRFVFPAPGPVQPGTPQEWFDKRYQILTADAAATILKGE